MAKQRSGAPAPPGQVNIIGQGTVIEGGLQANSDVRISGKVVGNVNVEGKTVVTPEGVVEGVAQDLAEEITETVTAPTIGIGASAKCDGQILVTNDMLGQSDWVPRFVRKFADQKSLTEEAVRAYRDAVREESFPGAENVYTGKAKA